MAASFLFLLPISGRTFSTLGAFFIFQGRLEIPLLNTFPICIQCNEVLYVCKIINYKIFWLFLKFFFQIVAGVLCYHLIRSIKRKAKSKDQQVIFFNPTSNLFSQIYATLLVRLCDLAPPLVLNLHIL